MKKSMNCPNDDPEQINFQLPSEGEHLFTVSDVLENIDPDPNIIHVKAEITNGEEIGRTVLNRLILDEDSKGFFAVRLFLKAINLPHKGQIEIDTEDFQGRQFFATIVHNKSNDGTKTYANISEYNFDKIPELPLEAEEFNKPISKEEVAWDDN